MRGGGDVKSFNDDSVGGDASGINPVDVPGLRPVGAVPVLVGRVFPPMLRSRRRRVGGRLGDGVGWPRGGGGVWARGESDAQSLIGGALGCGEGFGVGDTFGLGPGGAVPVLVGAELPPVLWPRRRWVGGRLDDGVGGDFGFSS